MEDIQRLSQLGMYQFICSGGATSVHVSVHAFSTPAPSPRNIDLVRLMHSIQDGFLLMVSVLHVAGGAIPNSGLAPSKFSLNQTQLMQANLDIVVEANKKRRMEPIGTGLCQSSVQKYQLQLGVDLNQNSGGCSHGSLAPHAVVHNNVSTGLCLALDDDRSTVTSSRPDSSSSFGLRDEISAQISQHQEELNQLIKTQLDHVRQAVLEKAQRQSKGLLLAVEQSAAKRLRERDMEMEKVKRRNVELEDSVAQLGMESQMWQTKAKNNEAMVAFLRSNLQQAMLAQQQSREQQSRLEGCGDSEVDDAASACIDDNPHAQQLRAMTALRKAHASASSPLMNNLPQSNMTNNEISIGRACRRCKAKEASVVLLPCLHLCLCVGCKDDCGKCPICSTLRSASVEVFLS
ncbi:hypothetical protein KP509_02G050000 [Ceratopteris richardii]|uniref:RING-type domain-containing protein n=1 Tax=Ceratopteris richardii TaxID=49495 RepID=A0A8T2V5K2_CERRI|nr:hypothetical protein KP509_02G050000 [Ceratopteris richardii]